MNSLEGSGRTVAFRPLPTGGFGLTKHRTIFPVAAVSPTCILANNASVPCSVLKTLTQIDDNMVIAAKKSKDDLRLSARQRFAIDVNQM